MAAGNILHTMKPTQEQIEAALLWADYRPHLPSECQVKHVRTLIEHKEENSFANATQSALDILAAAYREKCEELARAKETYAQRIAREYPKSKHL